MVRGEQSAMADVRPDSGLNRWGDIKVGCLLVNLVAWLVLSVALLGKRQEIQTSGGRRYFVVGVWVADGACLLFLFVNLIFFLF